VEAILGDPGHRWLTAQGSYEGNMAVLEVYQTVGGIFDSAEPRQETDGPIGAIDILWSDCEKANLSYQLNTPNVAGTIELRRVTEDNATLCESLTGQRENPLGPVARTEMYFTRQPGSASGRKQP
jgi:hypothetical protein